MGIVRKQSIQSSIFIYLGFGIGTFNFWLLPHLLTTEQFGLTRILMNVCTLLAGICSLGFQSTIIRFYPYYDDGKNHKSDFISWIFLIALIGYILMVVFTLFFKDFIIRKFQGNADLLVHYFYLIYPLTLFIMLYGLLERVAWSRYFIGLSSFLREAGVRLFTTIIVVALSLKWLGFTGFITLYSFQYALIAFILFYFLFVKKQSGFVFKISSTTRRLYKQMGWYSLFIFSGSLFSLIEQSINTILLGSKESLSVAGVFDIAFFMATLIVVPRRSMQGAASAIIARAWKERDLDRIERIYKKSAATLLIIGFTIFGLIWLNIDDIFSLYKPEYKAGKYVVLLVGLANLMDLGTGLNYDILVNSKIWKINFIAGIALIVLFLLVTYLFVTSFGMMGSAYAILLSLTSYNIVRSALLWWKFKIQPFTVKTVFILLGVLIAYFLAALLIPETGYLLINVALKSLVFVLIYGAIVLFGNLSEDITELFQIAKDKVLKR